MNKDVKIDSDIIENSKREIETIVKMCEKIGEINETEMATV